MAVRLKTVRVLLEIVAAVRAVVGPDFPISVKLNSADFQKGGFDFEDSLKVVQWLEKASVDLIEISGGTYEQPKLMGSEGVEPEDVQKVAPSTAAREAYFIDFANAMRDKVNVPLMVTGGFAVVLPWSKRSKWRRRCGGAWSPTVCRNGCASKIIGRHGGLASL